MAYFFKHPPLSICRTAISSIKSTAAKLGQADPVLRRAGPKQAHLPVQPSKVTYSSLMSCWTNMQFCPFHSQLSWNTAKWMSTRPEPKLTLYLWKSYLMKTKRNYYRTHCLSHYNSSRTLPGTWSHRHHDQMLLFALLSQLDGWLV